MSLLEVFGYIASVLIALSLMMSNIKRLRWINLFGAAAFSAYGYFIDAYPVFILNGWITLVDIYYLVRIYKEKDQFDLVKLKSVQTPLFSLLKERYGKDIKQLCTKFQWQQLDDAHVLLVFRNMKPVGFFAYRQLNDMGKVEVLLDYIIPEDRDFKAAKFMFSHQDNKLKLEGIKHLVVEASDENHGIYLKRVGFTKQEHYFELVLH
ncbi:hypothetical protein [Colwellia sp. MB02u-14]|uniref:hypothetical protein n=1 Tax=Colwellia sp. MB02u-14 TaxID=2759815 RepID=UPI0015F58EED|nr:hypothetical protein [Colwellia sp. MB02u-14]MBA6302757.1 hypothetical protein [Colwellia sp. MB02u-14]